MPARKYSDDLLDQAAELRESGVSIRKIARRLSMSEGAVYWHCLRLGADNPRLAANVTTPKGPEQYDRAGHVVRRFTPQEDSRLLELSLAGLRVSDICREIKRRPNSVRGRLMTLARQDARRELLEERAE